MSSSNICLLHPVAAFQVAEHDMRVRAVRSMSDEEREQKNVNRSILGQELGLLLGRLNFNKIEVQSTIQLLLAGEGDQVKIDSECFSEFYRNYSESFSDESHQILGLYSVDQVSNEEKDRICSMVSDFIKTELSLNISNMIYLEVTSDENTPFKAYEVENNKFRLINVESFSAPEELSAVKAMTENLSFDERKKLRALPYEQLVCKLRRLRGYLEEVKKNPALYDPNIVRRCNDVGLRFHRPEVSAASNSLMEENALMLLSTMLLQKSCKIN